MDQLVVLLPLVGAGIAWVVARLDRRALPDRVDRVRAQLDAAKKSGDPVDTQNMTKLLHGWSAAYEKRMNPARRTGAARTARVGRVLTLSSVITAAIVGLTVSYVRWFFREVDAADIDPAALHITVANLPWWKFGTSMFGGFAGSTLIYCAVGLTIGIPLWACGVVVLKSKEEKEVPPSTTTSPDSASHNSPEDAGDDGELPPQPHEGIHRRRRVWPLKRKRA